MAIALRGVSRSGFIVGRRTIVVGSGPIGLLTEIVLKHAGAGHITAIEPNAARRCNAEEIGAKLTINPMEEDVVSLFGRDLPSG